MDKQNSFGELFKKYRLKVEIPTLSEFGHLLAQKGFNYEDSIFSEPDIMTLRMAYLFREIQ